MWDPVDHNHDYVYHAMTVLSANIEHLSQILADHITVRSERIIDPKNEPDYKC